MKDLEVLNKVTNFNFMHWNNLVIFLHVVPEAPGGLVQFWFTSDLKSGTHGECKLFTLSFCPKKIDVPFFSLSWGNAFKTIWVINKFGLERITKISMGNHSNMVIQIHNKKWPHTCSNLVTHTSSIPVTFYTLLTIFVFSFDPHIVAEQLQFHIITNKTSLF